MKPGLMFRALGALWRMGLLRVRPGEAWRIFRAWRACGQSFALLAEMAAVRFGPAVALRDDDGCLTYTGLRAAYVSLAGQLVAGFGLQPGGQVVLIERNHRTFIVGLLAAVRAGADVLLVNPDSPPRVMDALLQAHPVDLVLHGADVTLGPAAQGLRRRVLGTQPPTGAQAVSLPRLRRAGRLVILTSGSTAAPKRVSRHPSLSQLLPTLLGLLESLPITLQQPTVLAVPLFHGHGLATLGMALALASPLHLGRRYEIAPLLARDPNLRAPVVVSVPTLLRRWLAHGAIRGSVATVVSGSAPLDRNLCVGLADALGPVLYNLYGSSEAGLVSLASPQALALAPGSVGRPLPGTAVRVVSPEGALCTIGTTGRILVHGPLVLYADAGGWFDTGDLGWFDAEQHLHVCGRSDGMFISGGENVYPQEVESVLRGHPAVEDAAITVVEDADFGQCMRAFVVFRPGEAVEPEAVRDWMKTRLDRFKVPRRIEVLAGLPRNPLGKIDRPALLAMP